MSPRSSAMSWPKAWRREPLRRRERRPVMHHLVRILMLQATLLVGSTLSAYADWLDLCKGSSDPVLLRNELNPGICERQDSMMKRADVTWESLIAKSPTEPSSLVIEGSTKDGHFVPERARGDNADALPR